MQAAAREKNVLKYISLLANSIHATQDLYTHSNWPELNIRSNCDCLDARRTFLSVLQESGGRGINEFDGWKGLEGIHTYNWKGPAFPNFNTHPGGVEHGEFCTGINHDNCEYLVLDRE